MINHPVVMNDEDILDLVSVYGLKAQMLGLTYHKYKYGKAIEIESSPYYFNIGSSTVEVSRDAIAGLFTTPNTNMRLVSVTKGVTKIEHERVFNVFTALLETAQ